ncbi:MAG TPA: NAD(P)H-hydrate dehydratase, partial [Thermoanaerobaculia bacterium]|nr:NAD(P)H-hydrate dehydratase [Thermoanaerobaculia bacterium]
VSVFTLGDPAAYRGDARANLDRLHSTGVRLERLDGHRASGQLRRGLADSDGVVDALFGTGLSRPLSGGAAAAVRTILRSGRAVVSADVPSGLSSDGGAVPGVAVRAEITVAFGAPKLCHVLPPASGLCGRLAVADIGISRSTLEASARKLWLTESSDVRTLLPRRPTESHKADFGRLAVVAGSRGKVGAAILAARGALRAGAGLVTVCCAESIQDVVVGALPEAMTFGLPESGGALAASGARSLLRFVAGFDAAVVGPGLGTAPETVAFLERFLSESSLPVVADADALNAFAGRPRFFAKRRSPTILTPHPGEAGRLLGMSASQIQKDRLASARSLARRGHAIAVLKGAHTLVATDGGEVAVNPTGTPLLATAGSGDVLAGAVGALLAGGLSPRGAAVAGVWLHGAAAERLARRLGDAGLLAHETADALPEVRAALRLRPRRT